jgi:hypothetical protein
MYKWYIAYKGETKIMKSGSRKLEISEFVFENKFFKPNNTIYFTITEEDDNWLYIRDDSIGIREGGETFEEAVENAIVHLVDKIEHLLNTSDEKLGRMNVDYKRKFESWEMSKLDQQAQ